MKKIIIVFLSITMFITASTSREEYEKKVSYYEKLISNAVDTYSTGQAVGKYSDYLNKDINNTYKYLLSKIKNNELLKKSFIASQNEWIKYRDKEFDFIQIALQDGGGSWTGIAIGMRMNGILESRLEYLIGLFPVEGDVGSISAFY